MTNERFSRTPPAKATELFEKLLATSDKAVKARERLFAELKEELDLLASLQEQHLFPILRQHGMHDLVQDATTDNDDDDGFPWGLLGLLGLAGLAGLRRRDDHAGRTTNVRSY